MLTCTILNQDEKTVKVKVARESQHATVTPVKKQTDMSSYREVRSGLQLSSSHSNCEYGLVSMAYGTFMHLACHTPLTPPTFQKYIWIRTFADIYQWLSILTADYQVVTYYNTT